MATLKQQHTPPEMFQSLIYDGSALPLKSNVLLLRSELGEYTLPETTIDPRADEQGFVRDIEAVTGVTVGPRNYTFKDSVIEHWPEAADAHRIVLPYQRATHFVLSRLVSGELSVASPYAEAEWVNILHLPEPELIDPFSLVSLNRFQIAWCLDNTY